MSWIQLSKRGRISPFPNYLSMEGVTSIMKDIVGYCHKEVLMTFQNRMCNVFLDKEGHEKVKKLALEKAKNEPDIIKKLIEEVLKLGDDFISFAKNIFELNLGEKSDQELYELYRKYCRDYKEIYSRYFVILTMENSVLEFLKSYICSFPIDEEMKSHYVSALTTSTRAMYPKEEEKELLKIALEASNLSEEEISQKIKEHTKKYFWLTRDYEDAVLTEDNFWERLNKLIEEGKVKEKLEKVEGFYSKAEKEIEKIERELKIDGFYSKLFELMRDGIYLKELRKRLVSESLYYMDKLLIEIGKRKNLTLEQMRHVLIDEVEDEISSEKIDERIRLSVYVTEHGVTKVYQGEEAEEIKDSAIPKHDSIRELSGLPVSPGKAKGPARIVFDPDDIIKVRPGDVMVTVQAVPSFTPAIKIAAALIADGGTGITSHPATLAREAGIPGVTGLKIATEILKDGDMIEVDGDKGIVRRL